MCVCNIYIYIGSEHSLLWFNGINDVIVESFFVACRELSHSRMDKLLVVDVFIVVHAKMSVTLDKKNHCPALSLSLFLYFILFHALHAARICGCAPSSRSHLAKPKVNFG